jgi:hypothetical protein
MTKNLRKSLAMTSAMLIALSVSGAMPGTASAKPKKMKSCAAAETLFQATGQGDTDGDGLSDCRESRQLRTSATNPDTDEDGLMDGNEVELRSDPLVADSDDDGLPDGDDESPRIPEQKVEGFLDALTCPAVGVVGSITILGTTAFVDDVTEFEHATCAELSEMLLAAQAEGTQLLVEVEVSEDALGTMTAVEVERKNSCGQHDDDHDDDDDSEGPGGGGQN